MRTALDLFMRREGDWRDESACLTEDPEMFFPPKGRNDLIQKAIGVCNGCPVRNQCLEFELENSGYESDHGVFGGTTEKERKALRRGAA